MVPGTLSEDPSIHVNRVSTAPPSLLVPGTYLWIFTVEKFRTQTDCTDLAVECQVDPGLALVSIQTSDPPFAIFEGAGQNRDRIALAQHARRRDAATVTIDPESIVAVVTY